jgi:hypothetical protein
MQLFNNVDYLPVVEPGSCVPVGPEPDTIKKLIFEQLSFSFLYYANLIVKLA